jgi:hypothetical protein
MDNTSAAAALDCIHFLMFASILSFSIGSLFYHQKAKQMKQMKQTKEREQETFRLLIQNNRNNSKCGVLIPMEENHLGIMYQYYAERRLDIYEFGISSYVPKYSILLVTSIFNLKERESNISFRNGENFSFWPYLKPFSSYLFLEDRTKHTSSELSSSSCLFQKPPVYVREKNDLKCGFCGASIDLTWRDIINQKDYEDFRMSEIIWNIWNENNNNNYLEWIPEEVLECILLLSCLFSDE